MITAFRDVERGRILTRGTDWVQGFKDPTTENTACFLSTPFPKVKILARLTQDSRSTPHGKLIFKN